MKTRHLLWLTAIAAIATTTQPQAQTVQDFYKGKRITMLVGYAAGSPFDVYARLLTRHMGKHIPGEPGFVVQHMPGAGSLTAMNHLANAASRDGTVMAAVHSNMGVEPKVGSGATRYDSREITWIGSMQTQSLLCITWHTSGLKTFQDLRSRVVIAGSSGGPGTSGTVFPLMMNSLVGTQFKLITGYSGGDLDLALERGEVEARCGHGWGALKALQPGWIKEQKVFIPIQLSLRPNPELPGVPTLLEFVKNPEDRQALEVMFTPQEIGRPFAAPPQVPADRARALRAAFDAALADPALLSEAERANLEIDPRSGVELERMIAQLYEAPDAVYNKLAAFRQADGK